MLNYRTRRLPLERLLSWILSQHLKKCLRPLKPISRRFKAVTLYLEPSSNQCPSRLTAVDDFAVAIFRARGYTRCGRVVRTRKDILFLICGEIGYFETVVDDNGILSLVQEDQRYFDGSNPEHQLIAKMIAAFAENDLMQESTRRADLKSCLESRRKGPRRFLLYKEGVSWTEGGHSCPYPCFATPRTSLDRRYEALA